MSRSFVDSSVRGSLTVCLTGGGVPGSDCEHFEGACGDFAGVGYRAEDGAVRVEDLNVLLVDQDVQGLADAVVADVDLCVADVDPAGGGDPPVGPAGCVGVVGDGTLAHDASADTGLGGATGGPGSRLGRRRRGFGRGRVPDGCAGCCSSRRIWSTSAASRLAVRVGRCASRNLWMVWCRRSFLPWVVGLPGRRDRRYPLAFQVGLQLGGPATAGLVERGPVVGQEPGWCAVSADRFSDHRDRRIAGLGTGNEGGQDELGVVVLDLSTQCFEPASSSRRHSNHPGKNYPVFERRPQRLRFRSRIRLFGRRLQCAPGFERPTGATTFALSRGLRAGLTGRILARLSRGHVTVDARSQAF